MKAQLPNGTFVTVEQTPPVKDPPQSEIDIINQIIPTLVPTANAYTDSLVGKQAGAVTYTQNTVLSFVDAGKIILANSANPISFTLPNPIDQREKFTIVNNGTGILTVIAPTGSIYNDNGLVSSLQLNQYQQIDIKTDGISWWYSVAKYTPQIAIVSEYQPTNTAGGTFAPGAWRTRVLNTIETDNIGITLATNQFTLPAGKYSILAFAPVFYSENNVTRLQNITDATTTLNGTNNFNGINTNGFICQSNALLTGVFSITNQKTFELQHYCTNSWGNSQGFGINAGITGRQEKFSTIKIEKIG